MHSIEPSALTCLASRDVTRVFRVVGTKTAQRTAIDIPVCPIPRPIRAAASVPRIHTLESLRPHTRGGQHPDDGRVRHPFRHVRRRRRDFTPGRGSEFTVGEESKHRQVRKGFSKDPGVHVLLGVKLLASTDANHGESAECRIVRRSVKNSLRMCAGGVGIGSKFFLSSRAISDQRWIPSRAAPSTEPLAHPPWTVLS